MTEKIEFLKSIYLNNDDFNIREIKNGKDESIYIVFFESLCDLKSIYNFVLKNIKNSIYINKKIKNLDSVLNSPKYILLDDEKKIFYYLENGFCLIFFKNEIYAVEVKAELDRGVTMSMTEPNMYGPKDSFCENYQKNLGLIKRRIKSRNLKADTINAGTYTKTKISILYIDEKTSKTRLEKVKNKLLNLQNTEITDTTDVVKILNEDRLFPTILKTEKPAIISKYLLKGYVVILIDNTPFALIVDAKLQDFVNPTTTDGFIKILRYICLFLTILTPAIYLALVNFNQETIPTSLLINFSEQRSGVPFPAIFEAVIMLIICEILRETDIRFPSNYGSAASILGALILGDAAVSAGIVSPIMIIIIAITFITNLIFTEVEFVWSIRLLRFSFLFLACFLGLYGLSIGMIVCLSIIANVKMNEGTYI